MTQSTTQIGANQSGLQYRTQDNDGKRALLNHHKGSSVPSYAEAGIVWIDDTATPWLLKTYDGADWIVLGEINATNNTFQPYNGAAVPRLVNHASDTGTANTYVVAPAPAVTAYVTGQVVTLKPGNANTGAATINVNGLGAKSIKTLTGAALSSGMLGTSAVHVLVYDGTNFVLVNPLLGSAAYLTAGTAANNLVQLDGSGRLPAVDGSQLTGITGSVKTVKKQIFTASGTYTPSTGMLYCYVELLGGGGGGGGSNGTAATGAGGGAGGHCFRLISAATIGASQTVTIGAAGSAGSSSGGTGGSGGNSSLGALMTANGGAGGTGNTNASTGAVAGGAGGTASTGDINITGFAGEAAFVASTGVFVSGRGANSLYGAGGAAKTGNSSQSGNAATGYGAGGGGGVQSSGAGGAGVAGICIVTEYCSQ